VLVEGYPQKVTDMKTATLALAISLEMAVSAGAFAATPADLTGINLEQNRELVAAVMQGRNYMIQVDQAGSIKQIIDTGANGDGKDPLQLAKSAVYKSSAATQKSVNLPTHFEGQDAINHIGVDLPKVAANYGLTAEALTQKLLQDDTLKVDSNNQLFVVDTGADHDNHDHSEPQMAGGSTAGTETATAVPIATTAQRENAFKLHSKPGASKTLYINFVGYTATGTAWSSSTIVAPAYDLNGDPTTFDDNERNNIISIWNRVAEDYIPFDIDVTTEQPSTTALIRSSTSDTTYGTQIVVTKKGTISCTCGGIAYIGMVAMINNTAYQPAWVFQQSLANNEKYIAEAISHEAGHTFGLLHDGTSSASYYSGHGSGTTGWAPIMGVGYYKNVTQWNSGTYPGANNRQNDFSVMAAKGLVTRTDDTGNTFDTATSLTNTTDNSAAQVLNFGIIETATDVDMYSFNTAGGDVSFTVAPAAKGPNLDTQLTLYSADGTVIASHAPVDNLSATLTANVSAGLYYLAVKDADRPANGSDYGYPAYGSLGQYQITGSFEAAAVAEPPVAVVTSSTQSGPASLTVEFSANDSIGNGAIVAYHWDFGDGQSSDSSNPTHTYTTVGNYTAVLTVTNEHMLTNTQTIGIEVTAPEVNTARVASMSMQLIKSTTTRAKVVLKLVDSQGQPVPNAIVTGAWSGTFQGSSIGKTNQYGVVTQISKPVSSGATGSGAYTVNKVVVSDYVYDATANTQNIVTLTW